MYVYVWMCVYCVKNALIFSKKSASKIYHEKIRQKFLSAVVPQLSAAFLRVRPPSCSSQFLKQKKKIFKLCIKEGGPFFR
jgi:hypothetical protein